MSMGQRHKHADVIIAWAKGKDIQVWSSVNSRWEDFKGNWPNFLADTEYRIKPSTKKYRVALFNTPSWGAIAVADNGENQGLSYEALPGFARWLTDWVEYEE